MKKIISFILATLMFTTFFSVANAQEVQGTNIESILKQKNVFSISSSNNNITRKINLKNVTNRKSKLNTKDFSSMLLKLGYSQDQIKGLSPVQIRNMFTDCAEITSTESYIKVADNGTTISISKDKCIEEVENSNKIEENSKINTLAKSNFITSSAYTLSSNNGKSTYTSSDGYMKIITTSTYLSPNSSSSYYQKGWYWFSATFQWLKMPKNRLTDAMSIYAPGFAWSQDSVNYNCSMTYELATNTYSSYPFQNSTTYESYTDYKTTKGLSLNRNGLFYKWNLPDNYYSYNYVAFGTTIHKSQYNFISELEFTIQGKARVSNYTQPYQFNLYSNYIHVIDYKKVEPQYSWSLGSKIPGVTLAVKDGTRQSTYGWLNQTNYNP